MNPIITKFISISLFKLVLAIFILLVVQSAVKTQALPQGFVSCAKEGEQCQFQGTKEVRYGADTRWIVKTVTNGIKCDYVTFGGDPAYGTHKQCYISTSAGSGIITPTIKFKNNAVIFASIEVYRGDQPYAGKIASAGVFVRGQSGVVNFPGGVPVNTPLEVEFPMTLLNDKTVTIYRATIVPNSTNSYCFETAGDVYKPAIKPCENTEAVEAKRLELKNEAGFTTTMTLNYTQQKTDGSQSAKTITTDEMILGFNRSIYLPRDAAPGSEMTLNINTVTSARPNPLSTKFYQDSFESKCWKAWGGPANVSLGPCSTSDAAIQKVKFRNNSATLARLSIKFTDPKGNQQTVFSNNITVLGEDLFEMPRHRPGTTLSITLRDIVNKIDFYKSDIPGNATGDLCFKAEGQAGATVGSTCDDVVGVTSGEIRQIRFQNDGGFDAQMVVLYFEDQVINGTTFAMPRTLSTGMITGLGGKFRLVNIPKNTSKGQPITILLQGSATVKNDFWSTTLPADFAANPQPCFKVWGTLFDPKGGTCNQ